MNKPIISFITINYDGIDDTIELINSIITNIFSVSYEIIVVDNASNNNEANLLEIKFDNIKCIRSERNLGFAGGNNLGIKASIGKYLFLINNDTYFIDDNIDKVLKRFEEDKNIGGISPKILFHQPFGTIQFAGYTKLTKITMRNSIIGFGINDDGQFNNSFDTPYLHGAAMIIKRDIIETTGLMCEDYFLYFEEIDWSERIKSKGYRLIYEPSCVVYHKESRSTGKNSPFRTFYITRNRLLFAKRNYRKPYNILSIIYQVFIASPIHILKHLLVFRFRHIESEIKGIIAFLKLKTNML